MQALTASAAGFSRSKVTSLPTQDGVGQSSPLLQFTSFYWKVISTCCWASASAQRTPPLLHPNVPLRRGAASEPAGPRLGAAAQGTLRGTPLSLRRQLGHWFLCGDSRFHYGEHEETLPVLPKESGEVNRCLHLPFYWVGLGCSQLTSSMLRMSLPRSWAVVHSAPSTTLQGLSGLRHQ